MRKIEEIVATCRAVAADKDADHVDLHFCHDEHGFFVSHECGDCGGEYRAVSGVRNAATMLRRMADALDEVEK